MRATAIAACATWGSLSDKSAEGEGDFERDPVVEAVEGAGHTVE